LADKRNRGFANQDREAATGGVRQGEFLRWKEQPKGRGTTGRLWATACRLIRSRLSS
jgi:hypothetical protein